MTGRRFAAGLVLGIAIGFALAALLDPFGEADSEAASRGRSGPGPAAESGDEPDRVHRGGDPTLEGRGGQAPRATTGAVPPTVPALLDASRRTRAAGDWDAFFDSLRGLGERNSLEADRELVSVLGDPTLRFRARLGEQFWIWLRSSEADGIAEAARRRMELEQQEFGSTAPTFLAELVGKHGSAEDRAWVEGLGVRATTQAVWRGFFTSGAPGAAELAERLLARRFEPHRIEPPFDGGAWWHHAAVEALARSMPDRALALIDEGLAARDQQIPVSLHFRDIVRIYAASAPTRDLGKLLPYLRLLFDRALADPRYSPWIRAVLTALPALEERGVDVQSFEDVCEWPTRFLLETVQKVPLSEAERALRLQALRALGSPAVWTAKARSRLEATLELEKGEEFVKGLHYVLREMSRAEDWSR